MECKALMFARLRQYCRDSALFQVLLARPALARSAVLLLAALVCLSALSLFSSPLATFEEQAGALAWRVAPETTPEERINIVAIDEKSIDALGAWPWSRATMARLATALSGYGVQLQMYDVIFPEAREGDAAFIAALQNGTAVVSQVPDIQTSQQNRTGLLTHPLGGIGCNNNGLPQASSYIANHSGFAGIAKGHIAPLLDADGAVRKVPALICVGDAAYPALSLVALLMASAADGWNASLSPGSGLLAPAQTLQLDAYPGFALPLDAQGNMRVSFRRAPESYRAFSAIDVIEGRIDRAMLENSWVLVGYTAFGLVDIVPTPFNSATPGVELQARLLGSFLDNNIPYTPASAPALLLLLSLLFAGLLLVLANRVERSGFALALCAVLLPLLALGLHVQLLQAATLWLGWLPPALFGVLQLPAAA